MFSSVGTSVQMTVVLTVVEGQLPQLDTKTLYSTVEQLVIEGLQVKRSC